MVRSLAAAVGATLLLLPTGAGTASIASTRVIVGFTAAGYPSAAQVERQLGAEVLARIEALRADVLRLDGDALALLRADPSVRYAELDSRMHALRVPNDPFFATQWSVVKTRAEQGWELSTGSAQVIVAILDTGIDRSQPDLGGKLTAGYDYVNNDQDPTDDNGHGTAVAGIVAADTDNGIGVAGYCWACRLMPVKVLGADGTGFMSGVAQGIVWATDHGARVINASLGGPADDATLAAAARYASAHGVLMVAAAGNESLVAPDYPAALPNVLSVAASDENDRLYGFSNSGALVAAPGENSTTGPGDSYISFLGTSSAAPVVSGIAGLAFSLAPSATPADVEQAIESTAVPVEGVVSGRVDAFGVLRALAPSLAPQPAGESEAGTGVPAKPAPARLTKVVRVKARLRKPATLTIATGPGSLEATARVAGRPARILLRLVSAGRVVAAARGGGGARLRRQVAAGRQRLLVTTSSRHVVRLVLTVAYPATP
jgi:subtilisin family serine protease